MQENPETPISISGPLLVCPGIPVTYSTDVPAGSTAHWEITNGEIIGPSTGEEVQVDFFAAYIPFEVSVWFENGTGCPSQPYMLTVEPDIPDLNFTEGETEVCGSSYATYAVAATDAETYHWQIVPASAGSIANGQNTNEVLVMWNQVSLQNVQVKVTARKCDVYFNNAFLVDIIDAPEITIIGPGTACAGHPVEFGFVSPPDGFANVVWDFGDGFPQDPVTDNVVTYTYTLPLANTTTYTVTATVYTSCALPSVDTFTITVSPSPVVTISPNHVSACSTNNTTFYINQQGGFASTDHIQWYKDGVAVGTDSPTFDAAGQPGDYYAVVTNSDGCTDTTVTVEARDCDTDGDDDGDGDPNPGTSCEDAPDLEATYITTVNCDGISIDITSISASTVGTYFLNWPFEATVEANTPTHLEISGLEPGHYDVSFEMLQNYNGSVCTSSEDIDFFIPYVAGLKYNISCAGNGLYNVELLNYSVYYPNTPPNQFSFNADNGSWHAGAPNADGIQSWTTQLPPGQHEVGIKIAYNGPNGIFAPCEAFVTMDLPQPPSAEFTFDAGCANQAVQFYASDTDGFRYEWDFDGIPNHQPNPAKTFFPGSYTVSLTVTDKYGCSDTWSQYVMVNAVDLEGTLNQNPAVACEGGSIGLTYDPDPNTTTPDHFEWYHNGPSDFPYAITDVPTLEVTESGQYYVFVQDANGCWEYDTQAISVSFITPPEPPVITGPEVVCGASEYLLKVPENEDIHYTWYLNGQSQPQWEGLAQITDSHATPGNYEYTVFSEITVDGVTCGSGPASFTVNVVAPPALPAIEVDVVSCSPYLMHVYVANAQPGTAYYWSNGGTGPETTMTHDGPIRVRAEVNNCSVSSQINLPTDLEALAWVFPKGCYDVCGEPKSNPYLLGPLGGFESWSWSVNHFPVSTGSGGVSDLHNLYPGVYSLMLDNGECNLNIISMNFDAVECPECALKMENLQISCVQINGVPAYKVGFDITNNSGGPLSVSLVPPDGEGYFADNTLFLPGGGLPQPQPQVLYFYPQNGFNGGNVNIVIAGEGPNGMQCYLEGTLVMPVCAVPRKGSINSMGEILLSLAPNPAKDRVHVFYQVLPDSRANSIVITDLFGRTLLYEPVLQNKGELLFDCSGFQAGTYMVILQQQGNTVTSVQLIVE